MFLIINYNYNIYFKYLTEKVSEHKQHVRLFVDKHYVSAISAILTRVSSRMQITLSNNGGRSNWLREKSNKLQL